MAADLPSNVVPLSKLEVGPFSAVAGQLGFGRQRVLAVVRESSSPGSTKRVLTTSLAIAAIKPKPVSGLPFCYLGSLPLRIPACIIPILFWNVLSIWTRCSNWPNPRLITPASRLEYRLSERK